MTPIQEAAKAEAKLNKLNQWFHKRCNGIEERESERYRKRLADAKAKLSHDYQTKRTAIIEDMSAEALRALEVVADAD